MFFKKAQSSLDIWATFVATNFQKSPTLVTLSQTPPLTVNAPSQASVQLSFSPPYESKNVWSNFLLLF